MVDNKSVRLAEVKNLDGHVQQTLLHMPVRARQARLDFAPAPAQPSRAVVHCRYGRRGRSTPRSPQPHVAAWAHRWSILLAVCDVDWLRAYCKTFAAVLPTVLRCRLADDLCDYGDAVAGMTPITSLSAPSTVTGGDLLRWLRAVRCYRDQRGENIDRGDCVDESRDYAPGESAEGDHRVGRVRWALWLWVCDGASSAVRRWEVGHRRPFVLCGSETGSKS